jgi:hypothetical protein
MGDDKMALIILFSIIFRSQCVTQSAATALRVAVTVAGRVLGAIFTVFFVPPEVDARIAEVRAKAMGFRGCL